MGDESAAEITLATEQVAVHCLPAQGGTIASLRDGASGAEALWRWPRVEPAPCGRDLGPAGAPSIASFIDRFVGGWFTMFPAVGYPDDDAPPSLLHGELVRLPWEVVRAGRSEADLRVETVRTPFAVERRIAVAGAELRVEDRIRNVGAEPAPFAYGQHPCLSRATFAGGTLELTVERAEVPDPPHAPAASRLATGTVAWPGGRLRDGEPTDLSAIPAEPDGRVDHVCVRPAAGRARVTAPSAGRALVLEWHLGALPELLLWQDFRSAGGWPFWGAADTFGLEPSTIPGRTMGDARAAGAIRHLDAGASFETSMSARWEAL